MRLRSLVILLVLAAAVAYVYFFQWDLVTSLTDDVRLNLAGYTVAKNPQDAMDRFAKAIKARDYSGAARYCTKDFADNLIKGKKAAFEIGYRIDRLLNLMADKGFDKSEPAMMALYALDPFPALFQRSSDKEIKEEKKGEPKMIGWYKTEPVKFVANLGQLKGLDPKMLDNALMPGPDDPTLTLPGRPKLQQQPELFNRIETTGLFYGVFLLPEGDGDNKVWKLDFPKEQVKYVQDKTDYFIKNYRSYVTGLEVLLDYIHREKYAGPKEWGDQVISVLASQTEK
jgi:hypothetical protein